MKKTSMNILAGLMAGAGLLLSAGAQAQDAFPTKPIRIVLGFPAGGPLDQHARLLTDKLQGVLGQPLVVDYKPGAGGSVGAQDVMRSPADGYTLMLANTGVMVINPALYSKLPYNTLKDFTPIARTAMQPLALLVNNKVPAKTLTEFTTYAKANPGKINFAAPQFLFHQILQKVRQGNHLETFEDSYTLRLAPWRKWIHN